jgi:AcrR family transcriptional regulator
MRGRRRPGRPSAGTTPLLSRQRILEAALRQIDRDGVESLAIRTLSAELGVAPNSLYSYVRDKDDLIRGAITLLFANAAIPPHHGESWSDRLRGTCCWFRKELLRHPNVVAAPAFRETYPFGFFPLVYVVGEILRDAGLEDHELIEGIFAVFYHTVGFVTLEVARAKHGIAATSDDSILKRTEGDLEEDDVDETARLLPLVRDVDLESVFEKSLDSIIAGIAATLQSGLRPVPGKRLKRAARRQ